MYSLDVIVPFYNEENYLEESVNNLLREKIHSKIYLVNNNSNDRSKEIALKLCKENKDILYIETGITKGKGFGIQCAIESLESTHTIIHDADLEYFPKDIKKLREKSEEFKDAIILGSRFLGDANRDNKYKRTIFANKFLSKFFSIVFNVKITDVSTCYKLLPNKYLKKMRLSENGFSIEIEMVAKYLKFANPKIVEVPIDYKGRTFEEGKKINVIDGVKYLIKTIYYRFYKL